MSGIFFFDFFGVSFEFFLKEKERREKKGEKK
jgi:hypothetical protein